jgi:hypothetical protein
MKLEYCAECDEPTGRAGRDEDSIYLIYEVSGVEVGPLCPMCRDNYLVCEECGYAVLPEHVTYNDRHEGCGGVCS